MTADAQNKCHHCSKLTKDSQFTDAPDHAQGCMCLFAAEGRRNVCSPGYFKLHVPLCLSIYIYIYMYTACVYIHIDIHIYI